MSELEVTTEKDGTETVQFALVGMASCVEFQKCLALIELLHKKQPLVFLKPYIRPMLEFDWLEYLKETQRDLGGILWHLEQPMVLFINDKLLGNDQDLDQYLSDRFQVSLIRDYRCLAQKNVFDIYAKYFELGRKFVFLSIEVNRKVIGHLIFMLYADLVPKTCQRFLNYCKRSKRGYKGTEIHRIMSQSWIQCGGTTLKPYNRANENYEVAHNRRGVLSMCNNGQHRDNTTQFFVCLDSTPWMDYKYVGIGQLIQGEYVLRDIEKLSIPYQESPKPNVITIANCGEILLHDDELDATNLAEVEKYIAKRDFSHFGATVMGVEQRRKSRHEDRGDLRDVPSTMLQQAHEKLLYSLEGDDKSHLPINNILEEGTSVEEKLEEALLQVKPSTGEKLLRFSSAVNSWLSFDY